MIYLALSWKEILQILFRHAGRQTSDIQIVSWIECLFSWQSIIPIHPHPHTKSVNTPVTFLQGLITSSSQVNSIKYASLSVQQQVIFSESHNFSFIGFPEILLAYSRTDITLWQRNRTGIRWSDLLGGVRDRERPRDARFGEGESEYLHKDLRTFLVKWCSSSKNNLSLNPHFPECNMQWVWMVNWPAAASRRLCLLQSHMHSTTTTLLWLTSGPTSS